MQGPHILNEPPRPFINDLLIVQNEGKVGIKHFSSAKLWTYYKQIIYAVRQGPDRICKPCIVLQGLLYKVACNAFFFY